MLQGPVTRHCNNCKTAKPASEFQTDTAGKFRGRQCRTCQNAKWRTYSKGIRDRINKAEKNWSQNNPDKMKKNNRTKRRNKKLKLWGLTHDDLQKTFELQKGLCAICVNREISLGGGWNTHLDHDPITNRFRGILCRVCNTGLGHFKDDHQLLQRAIIYLTGAKK